MTDTHHLQANCNMDDPADIRRATRAGAFTGVTAGVAPGYTQGNLAILPAEHALDFMRYCQRNPKPCPLIGVSATGDPSLPTLGRDIDIRTDVANYNVYRDGELTETVTDIRHLWRDDFVAFVLGCSYTFEQALVDEGVGLRHLDEGLTVPMWHTSIETSPAGSFGGGMVVSMRPLNARNAVRAVEITSRFPHAHGSPVHLGNPSQIGIEDITAPDWGDALRIESDEIPVFWACGVTPQIAIRQVKPEICITHTPGSLLISDLPSTSNSQLTE